jgi:hypothetical protein
VPADREALKLDDLLYIDFEAYADGLGLVEGPLPLFEVACDSTLNDRVKRALPPFVNARGGV